MSTATEPATHQVHPTLIVIYLALGGVSFAMLQSLVAPALGTIGADLGITDTSSTSWILTAYLLSAAVLTPVLGRLGDMVGKRKILIVVLALLLAGAVVSALAPNLAVLIVGRVLQGAAGAVMPLSIGIVRDELPRERVSVTIGILSAIFGIGAGVGIVGAGPIVEHLDWHWLFWIPAVFVVIALLGTIFGMPESPVRKPGRLDFIGTGLLSVSLIAILVAISEGEKWGWADGKTIGLAALGVVFLLVFVLAELRIQEPLVDLRLFASRGVWTAHVVALMFGFAMFGTFLLIPTILQLPTATGYGFGEDITAAGLYMLPTVVMMIIAGPVSGALVRMVGPKPPMIIGSVFIIAAFAVPTISHSELWQILLTGALTGVGIGFAMAAMSNAIIESVPVTQTGEAISANTVVRTVGSSIGTAIIAAVITANSVDVPGTSASLPTDDAFTYGFAVSAAVGVLALVGAILAPSMKRRLEAARAAGIEDVDTVSA